MYNLRSALNLPLNRGDLVCTVRNQNGFIEVTKGVVLDVLSDISVRIVGTKGDRYLYGKSILNNDPHTYFIRSLYARTLINVSKDHANADPDFIRLFNSDKYKVQNL